MFTTIVFYGFFAVTSLFFIVFLCDCLAMAVNPRYAYREAAAGRRWNPSSVMVIFAVWFFCGWMLWG